MQGQAPMMQSMMSNYLEQSKNLFFQMQDQMQQQARSMFSGFPGTFPMGQGSSSSQGWPDAEKQPHKPAGKNDA